MVTKSDMVFNSKGADNLENPIKYKLNSTLLNEDRTTIRKQEGQRVQAHTNSNVKKSQFHDQHNASIAELIQISFFCTKKR